MGAKKKLAVQAMKKKKSGEKRKLSYHGLWDVSQSVRVHRKEGGERLEKKGAHGNCRKEEQFEKFANMASQIRSPPTKKKKGIRIETEEGGTSYQDPRRDYQ